MTLISVSSQTAISLSSRNFTLGVLLCALGYGVVVVVCWACLCVLRNVGEGRDGRGGSGRRTRAGRQREGVLSADALRERRTLSHSAKSISQGLLVSLRTTSPCVPFVLLMFSLSTVTFGIYLHQTLTRSAFSTRPFPLSGPSPAEAESGNVVSPGQIVLLTLVLTTWCADGVLLWRCKVLYGSTSDRVRKGVYVLLGLLAMVALAIGIRFLVLTFRLPSAALTSSGPTVIYPTTFAISSVVVNIVFTALIVARILAFTCRDGRVVLGGTPVVFSGSEKENEKAATNFPGTRHKANLPSPLNLQRIVEPMPSMRRQPQRHSVYTNIISMLVESATLIVLVGGAYSVWSSLDNDGIGSSGVLVGALGHISVISSTLIIYRVAQGKAYSADGTIDLDDIDDFDLDLDADTAVGADIKRDGGRDRRLGVDIEAFAGDHDTPSGRRLSKLEFSRSIRSATSDSGFDTSSVYERGFRSGSGSAFNYEVGSGSGFGSQSVTAIYELHSGTASLDGSKDPHHCSEHPEINHGVETGIHVVKDSGTGDRRLRMGQLKIDTNLNTVTSTRCD